MGHLPTSTQFIIFFPRRTCCWTASVAATTRGSVALWACPTLDPSPSQKKILCCGKRRNKYEKFDGDLDFWIFSMQFFFLNVLLNGRLINIPVVLCWMEDLIINKHNKHEFCNTITVWKRSVPFPGTVEAYDLWPLVWHFRFVRSGAKLRSFGDSVDFPLSQPIDQLLQTISRPFRNLRRAAAIFDARSVPLVLNQVGSGQPMGDV